MKNVLSGIFGRINDDGHVNIFDADGNVVRRLEVPNVYPVGSSVSTQYEHPDGITLFVEDCHKLGIELED